MRQGTPESFGKSDKLAIGRYDFGSPGSRSNFLTSGLMYTDLNDVGTEPDDRQRLNSWSKNGAKTSAFSFSRETGRPRIACQEACVRQLSLALVPGGP